jgi:hypothetical protein
MKFRRCFALLPFALSGAAFAQSLPAPAPLPQRATGAPKPAAPAPDPLLLDDPLPTEAPIIIGEPVRRQTAPKPQTAKPSVGETPKRRRKLWRQKPLLRAFRLAV